MAASDLATFQVWVAYGPPRPMLVLSIFGDVDRSNDDQLSLWLDYIDEATRGLRPLDEFDCRAVSTAVVVDLSDASVVGAHALGLLSRRVDAAGRGLRLVAPSSAAQRGLRALGVAESVETFPRLADAVVAGAVVPP